MSQIDEMSADNISVSSDIVETVVGSKTRFKGNITTDKPIRIDGTFEGDIDSQDLVLVTKAGNFNGTVKCKEMLLEGFGEGTVTCTASMKFAPTGHFKGDVTTKDIIINEGSVFDGNLTMSRN